MNTDEAQITLIPSTDRNRLGIASDRAVAITPIASQGDTFPENTAHSTRILEGNHNANAKISALKQFTIPTAKTDARKACSRLVVNSSPEIQPTTAIPNHEVASTAIHPASPSMNSFRNAIGSHNNPTRKKLDNHSDQSKAIIRDLSVKGVASSTLYSY